MKNILTFCFFCFALNMLSQNSVSSNDSINTFYNSLLKIMKTDYLYKNDVDWPKKELELKERLTKYNSFENSLNEITSLFDGINANHCSVYYKNNSYSATYNGPSENDFSEQWLKKYDSGSSFEVKILDDNYGYILVPSINFEDISSENINKIAQPLYDKIAKIKETTSFKGWIIDLRINTGGNIYPMLLALYDFLGNNPVFGVMNNNKDLVSMTKMDKGKYIEGDTITSYIIPNGKKLTKTKVAIIIGNATASSGEITALAFKGRKNTIYIGKETMGMTTTNEKRDLPHGAFMALTIGYDSDRYGKFYQKIIPDTVISGEDNFDNLLSDPNIDEAINYFNKK